MKLQTEDFRTAFKVIDAVETSAVQDSSQFVRLRQNAKELTLALTGALWAEANATASDGTGKWTAFVDRRALKAFLNTTSSPEIELFYKDKLILKSGQRLEIALHAPISGYETWTPKSTFDLTDLQKLVLKAALSYLPNMAGTENVAAVCFDKDYGIIVTDTLFMMGVTACCSANSFLLPSAVAKVLSAGGQVASDKNGVGVALTGGFVYEPLSAPLANYPGDKCKAALIDGQKSPTLATVKGRELLDALRVAGQFLVDKAEAVSVESKGANLTLTVDLGSSKFQRNLGFAGTGFTIPIKWPARKLVPWLEYALGVKDGDIRISKTVCASVFQFTEAKHTNVLLSADL